MSTHRDEWNRYGVRYDEQAASRVSRGRNICKCGQRTNDATGTCVSCQVENRAGAQIVRAGYSAIELLARRHSRPS